MTMLIMAALVIFHTPVAEASPVTVICPSDHPRFAEYLELLTEALEWTVLSDSDES